MANLLTILRERKGLTLEKVAERARTSATQIHRLEKGSRRMTWDWAMRLAEAYDVEPAELMYGGEPPRVPVVGYVGAGQEVFPIDDHEKGGGIAEVECPRGLNPATTVAVKVLGDLMQPIQDGWTLFYTQQVAGAADAIGHLCVVKLANDGPTLVKEVRRAPTPGKFNLVSSNAGMREDAELEWAARVRAILPPEG